MPTFDSFRTARWVRLLNLVLQAILFITLFAGLNYLARNYAWRRFDLTQQRRYSLSPETLAYLRTLARPVRIVVTLNPVSENLDIALAYRDVNALLREYTYATEADPNRRVTVQYLDVYKNRRDADQLGIDQPDAIVLICGERRRTVPLSELYKLNGKMKTAFRGEQAFTAAILDVSNPGRKKIYFLTGHGELNPEDVDPVRGLSLLRDELRSRNFDVDRLELASTKIPADASLLIAVAPQGRFTPAEEEQLRQYLGPGAGRMIILLEPELAFGLSSLLLDWGVLVDDDIVYDTGLDNMTEEGDLMLRFYLPHPITQTLIDRQIPLRIGPARSLRPDPGRRQGNDLTVTTLVVTSPTAWGEVGYRQRNAPVYNPGVDIRNDRPGLEPNGHLAIAMASERVKAQAGLDFSVRGGRLVVFGTGDLIANNRIAGTGNLNIFLSAVNWSVDRDTQLNVPVRQIERYSLSLSAGDLARLRRSLLFLLPGAALLLGLIVYWTRRR